MKWMHLLFDGVIILILIIGIRQFRTPRGARIGNLTAAFAIVCAFLLVLLRNEILAPGTVLAALLVGAAFGWAVAVRVNMTQIPAMVAFQHGAGGVAAFLVAFVELSGAGAMLATVNRVSGLLGLIIGSATFSASLVASGKLANRLRQTPTRLPAHGWVLIGNLIVIAAACTWAWVPDGPFNPAPLVGAIILSALLGVLFSIRIGGADMPVLISFLNATAGLAAAFCGIIIQNRLLIACGATVAASGSILTHVMCKAMNRDLFKVFVGIQQKISAKPGEQDALAFVELEEAGGEDAPEGPEEQGPPEGQPDPGPDAMSRVVSAMKEAKKLIIIPGYGMALAQAQFSVCELAARLEGMGKEVKFAIHPVAGRMPGHMNVLLAEAEVDYDRLFEMDEINPKFKETDLALIVGACDVVNPAAISVEDTPISGMPILMAHEAANVAVCNLDEKPGYSGVKNPLYEDKHTILLFGDAKETVTEMLKRLN
jgi:H+-translocating NAD(P) transhydrogenase subunit beta